MFIQLLLCLGGVEEPPTLFFVSLSGRPAGISLLTSHSFKAIFQTQMCQERERETVQRERELQAAFTFTPAHFLQLGMAENWGVTYQITP